MVCKSRFIPRINDQIDFDILLIFIHGFGGCMEQWSNQTKYFVHFFDQLYFELPGHGENQLSERENFSMDLVLQNIESECSAYKHKSKIGIAHSYGCALLSMLVERQLYSFDFLVFCAPCLFCPISEFAKTIVLRAPNWIVNVIRLLDRIGGPRSLFIQRCLHNKRNELTECMMNWGKSFNTNNLKLSLSALKWPFFKESVVSTPIFVVHGTNDMICCCDRTLELCKNFFSNSECIAVENCGHQVMLEYDELVNALIFERIRNRFNVEIGTIDFCNNELLPKCPFKNKEKWLDTDSFGSIFYNFLPMKVKTIIC